MSDFIEVFGASEHNLKHINIKIPRDKFIVITGVSGSGKSSLAYDTLYKEGQRRYVESLSAYARQFLGRVKKPDVEKILGLPPAIAIEQKIANTNPRSTVGTVSEVYDYLRILFARLGRTYSPHTNKEVKKHTAYDVADYVMSQKHGTKLFILAPIIVDKEIIAHTLADLMAEGFIRVRAKINNNTQIFKINELLQRNDLKNISQLWVVIDRLKVQGQEQQQRIVESAKIAFEKGDGKCCVLVGDHLEVFSNRFEENGVEFIEPTPELFSFTSPLGACPVCKGFGNTLSISEDLVIPNKNLSVAEGAVAPWRGEKMSRFQRQVISTAEISGFPIFKPYRELSEQEKYQLWHERKYFIGIMPFFEWVEKRQDQIQYRIMLMRYRAQTVCPACRGTRLREETRYIKVNGKSIQDLVLMPIENLKQFFEKFEIDHEYQAIARRIVPEIKRRLEYLCDVGLGYLTLNRSMRSLSGGEAQRIRLASALGSALVGSLYILDEPTIGLHARDTKRLASVLRQLQKQGNTIIVVEHDPLIMKEADMIIDMGPGAGAYGGQVVFQGSFKQILKSNTLTAEYLSGEKTIPVPLNRRKPSQKKGFIIIKGASEHNLKNIDVKIPLGLIVAITGVSGSGKSTLIRDVLLPAVEHKLGIFKHTLGAFQSIEFDTNKLKNIVFVDQNPIGKSSRSNALTYLGIYDYIREIFANQPLAKNMGFTPAYFSFNVEGGRCENCQGEGVITVEMQFMADVKMVCEVCKGKRFKDEVLEVKFRDKNIYDILEMTVDSAVEFFKNAEQQEGKHKTLCRHIVNSLHLLQKVGLGYIKLGQPSSTYSGGELQRLKLASFLSSSNKDDKTLFIFDEPTVGLHYDDINKLVNAFNELIARGNSIIFIEHNMEMIKIADWVIDLGPEGGEKGGQIVFEGTPEQLITCEKSYTAKFLKEALEVGNENIIK